MKAMPERAILKSGSGRILAGDLLERSFPYLLTADDTAELLRTSRKGIYSMASRGELPGVTRIGRRLLLIVGGSRWGFGGRGPSRLRRGLMSGVVFSRALLAFSEELGAADGSMLAWSGAPAWGCESQAKRVPLDSGAAQSSRGAPTISRGCRKLLPVKRRIDRKSTSRSAVATAVASEGKRFFHFVKPALAVRRVEPCRWRAETTRKR